MWYILRQIWSKTVHTSSHNYQIFFSFAEIVIFKSVILYSAARDENLLSNLAHDQKSLATLDIVHMSQGIPEMPEVSAIA